MRRRNLILEVRNGIICALFVIVCFASTGSKSEDKKPWEAGLIVEVKTHQPAPGTVKATRQYDLSILVGNKVYVVLYSPANGELEPGCHVGRQSTVLVEGNKLKVNDILGHTRVMPILSSKAAPPEASK